MPEFPIVGDPVWYVTWFSEPEAWIVSAASTVIWFWIPDTVTLAQWPVITMLLVIPLTSTVPPLHVMARVSLMPETVMLSPAGAVAPEVDGIVKDGVGLTEGEPGMGNMVGRPLRET